MIAVPNAASESYSGPIRVSRMLSIYVGRRLNSMRLLKDLRSSLNFRKKHPTILIPSSYQTGTRDLILL
jgi:hypothetical protein